MNINQKPSLICIKSFQSFCQLDNKVSPLHRYFRCLKDRPYPKDFKYMNSLPGVFATMDEQCRFSFGPGYERCDVCIFILIEATIPDKFHETFSLLEELLN